MGNDQHVMLPPRGDRVAVISYDLGLLFLVRDLAQNCAFTVELFDTLNDFLVRGDPHTLDLLILDYDSHPTIETWHYLKSGERMPLELIVVSYSSSDLNNLTLPTCGRAVARDGRGLAVEKAIKETFNRSQKDIVIRN